MAPWKVQPWLQHEFRLTIGPKLRWFFVSFGQILKRLVKIVRNGINRISDVFSCRLNAHFCATVSRPLHATPTSCHAFIMPHPRHTTPTPSHALVSGWCKDPLMGPTFPKKVGSAATDRKRPGSNPVWNSVMFDTNCSYSIKVGSVLSIIRMQITGGRGSALSATRSQRSWVLLHFPHFPMKLMSNRPIGTVLHWNYIGNQKYEWIWYVKLESNADPNLLSHFRQLVGISRIPPTLRCFFAFTDSVL